MAAVLALGPAAGPAAALPTAPSVKPADTRESKWLTPADFAQLRRALDAADENRWGDVRQALAKIGDAGAATLVRWRMATDGNSGVGFTELSRAAEEFRGWPDRDKIVSQAELLSPVSSLSVDDRIAWLTRSGPSTGEGVLALADAYKAKGQPDAALRIITNAWRTSVMSQDAARTMQLVYGSQFTSEDYAGRIDMLMWRGLGGEAQKLFGYLAPGRKAEAEARLALMQNKKTVDPLLAAVPEEYASSPGLLYERARWRERRGQDLGALDLFLQIRGSESPDYARADIWAEKQSVIRRLIRERNYQTAYDLAANHGLTAGEAFRDAEWTAGWLALEKLNNPLQAEAHFRVFGNGVDTPISIARAQYWLGEALRLQNRPTEAQAAYEAAAKYPFVFYGQLAAEKLADIRPELRMIAFDPIPAPSEADRLAFAQRPIVRAALVLAETGRMASFERFAYAIDDQLMTPAEHQMLSDLCRSYLEMRAAVRGAKAGLGRGLVAPDAVFPILSLPKSPRTGSAEDAMVMALARQESELNPRAISSADARGLMQLVPRYAQAEARMVGLPFRTSWLTDDPTYNLRLGRGFLDDLVDDFGGSYVLAAAAYNAGPTRARQWIRDFGDPRGAVDPVDWIESIPFAETRNYVQRVLENTQVYRHRLSGQPTRIQLMDDLHRGRPGP